MAYHPLLKLDISSNRQKCYIINLKYICMSDWMSDDKLLWGFIGDTKV